MPPTVTPRPAADVGAELLARARAEHAVYQEREAARHEELARQSRAKVVTGACLAIQRVTGAPVDPSAETVSIEIYPGPGEWFSGQPIDVEAHVGFGGVEFVITPTKGVDCLTYWRVEAQLTCGRGHEHLSGWLEHLRELGAFAELVDGCRADGCVSDACRECD